MASNQTAETISTLNFARGAKKIKNKPEVNEVVSEEALLQRYRKEIATLKEKLESLENREVPATPQAKVGRVREMEDKEQLVAQKDEERQELDRKIQKLAKMILSSSPQQGNQRKRQKMDAKANRRKTWFPGMTGSRDEEDNDFLKLRPSTSREQLVDPDTELGPEQSLDDVVIDEADSIVTPLPARFIQAPELKRSLEEYKGKLAEVEAKLLAAQSQAAAENRKHKDLNKTREFLEMELEATKLILEETVTSQDAELKTLRSELAAGKQRLAAMEDERDMLSDQVSQLEMTTEKIRHLQQERSQMQSWLQETQAELEVKAQELESLVAERDAFAAVRTDLEDQIKRLTSELAESREEVKSIQEHEADRASLEAQLSIVKQQLQEQLDANSQQQQESQLALAEAQESQERLVQAWKKEKAVLQSQVQQAEARLADLTRTNAELQESVEVLEQLVSQLRSDENSAAKKLAKLEKKLEVQEQVAPPAGPAESENGLVACLRFEVERLQAELTQLKRENQTANLTKSHEITQGQQSKMLMKEANKQLEAMKQEKEKMLKSLRQNPPLTSAAPALAPEVRTPSKQAKGTPLASIENRLHLDRVTPVKRLPALGNPNSRVVRTPLANQEDDPGECNPQ